MSTKKPYKESSNKLTEEKRKEIVKLILEDTPLFDELDYTALNKMEKGNFKEALADILESIKINSVAGNNEIAALIYLNLKNYHKALEHSNISIEKDDTQGDYFVTRAKIYLKINDIDSAKRDLEKAIKLNNENPFADCEEALDLIKNLNNSRASNESDKSHYD